MQKMNDVFLSYGHMAGVVPPVDVCSRPIVPPNQSVLTCIHVLRSQGWNRPLCVGMYVCIYVCRCVCVYVCVCMHVCGSAYMNLALYCMCDRMCIREYKYACMHEKKRKYDLLLR